MIILRRLTLLTLFAALGATLALYVVFLTSPPTHRDPVPHPRRTAENVGTTGRAGHSEAGAPHMPAARQGDRQPAPSESHSPRTDDGSIKRADSDWLQPAMTIPPGPLLAEPHPRKAFQFAAAGQKPGLLRGLGLWRDLAATMLRQAAAGDGEAEPAPAPPPSSSDQAPATLPKPAVDTPSSITRTVPGEGRDELEIDIKDENILGVLESLSKLGNLNILASENVTGTVSATLRGVDVETALDAILKSTGYVAKHDGQFIYVGTPNDFDKLEQSLDVITTRVYRPNYVTAAELQALIQPLLTPESGTVGVSSPAQVGIGADATNAGGDDFAGGEVVVVRDYEAVLTEVDQVVAEIDKRPMQVAIEAMILSVTLDDENEFGVSFELLRNQEYLRLGWGSPLDSLAELKFDDGGLKFGFLDSSLGSFLNALESIGDTNVIATPQLMVINKHRAEILIGEELGYVSTTITETSSSQSVEFLEVGAQLRLRPFISSDGLIRMEVHPELSTGSVDTQSGFTLPNKETTQVTTNIMVRDGCTVIIGGLIRDELQTTAKQVPFFGSLPVVGVAFRSTTEQVKRREILVLITPRIVYEPETCREGRQEACEFQRRQQVYAEKMSPWGKRHVGRKYSRLAENAWAAGDRRTALRFAELSVHFDPLNRAAIDLRSNIWLGQRVGDHAHGDLPPGESSTAPLDGTVIAPWLLEDLEGEPLPESEIVHPLDPGRPGGHVDLKRPRSLQ